MLRRLLAVLALLLLTDAHAACQATLSEPLILQRCMQNIATPAGMPAGLRWHQFHASTATADTLLDLGLPDAYQVIVLQKQGAAWRQLARLDEHSRYQDRPLRHRRLIVPLAPISGPTELIVGFRTHGTTPITPRLLTREQLIEDDTRADLANGIIFGIMLVLIPLLAVGLGTHMNNSYRIYAGLVITSVLFIGQAEGYCFQFYWPDSPRWNMLIPELLVSLMMIWHAAFSISLLDMRWRMPLLYRLNQLMLVAGALIMLIHLFTPVTEWVLVQATLYVLLSLGCAWQGVRQNVPAARFYLLGVMALCIAGVLLTSMSMLWFHPFPGVPVTEFPKFGYLGETFFFGAAVLNQLRLQNEQRAAIRLQRLAESEQLRQAEETRRHAMAEAEAQRLRLASASHDISQPLASLRFAIAALSQQQEQEQGHITAHIENTLNYAQTLLKDLMDQARREAAPPELIALAQLFTQLEHEFGPAARQKHLQLRCHTPHLYIHGSALLLYRILNNLLANAIRYTSQGKVVLGARRRRGAIELQVWDSGPGIAPSLQQALLAPWQQGESSAQGYGLGLFIVRHLCEQCGYQLLIHSAPGRGSGFCIIIPD